MLLSLVLSSSRFPPCQEGPPRPVRALLATHALPSLLQVLHPPALAQALCASWTICAFLGALLLCSACAVLRSPRESLSR